MKKIALLLLFALLIVDVAKASQNPLYSQFMTNPFVINPALAGTYPYYQINLNSRLQWVGMTDAPMTNVISMHGPMVSQPMGLGGYFMHDVTGPTSNTSFNASYAYNYSIAEDLKISMGLTLGIKQYKIDGLQVLNPDDPFYQSGQVLSKLAPDAAFGVYVYSSIYHGGIAITQLFGNKLKFGADSIPGDSRLNQHIFVHGGYKYLINREMSVEPTLILRKVKATPLQIDFNCRFWYGARQWNNNKLWGGVSYRSQDAISILVGVLYQRKIEFGYSYDIGINKFRSNHGGSHEISIGFKFNDIKEY